MSLMQAPAEGLSTSFAAVGNKEEILSCVWQFCFVHGREFTV